MKRVRFRDDAGNVRGGRWTTVDGDPAVTSAADPVGDGSFDDDTYRLDEIEVLPPSHPTKIVCVGLNYRDHAAEQGKSVPDRPMLFLKTPNTIRGHGATVTLPAGKSRVDHEAELAVVIGQRCRNVDRERAESVIAGFTCMNDLSNRDDQEREQNWVRAKAFDGAAPLGPLIATPDHVPSDATVECRVNGELRQQSSREEFIFSIPDLVAEITTYMTLEPGDVISTGTPAGVGPLEDGDRVEITVEGVGTLANDVESA